MWAWRKKATCRRGEQTFENAVELKYIHRGADDVNRKKKVNKVLNKIPIFEQGAVQANNSTTLCVTLLGREQNFQLWACRKKATCGRGEQTFENAFELKYIHSRADDVNQS